MREYKKDISFSAICISVPTKQNKSKNTGLTLLTLVEVLESKMICFSLQKKIQINSDLRHFP